MDSTGGGSRRPTATASHWSSMSSRMPTVGTFTTPTTESRWGALGFKGRLHSDRPHCDSWDTSHTNFTADGG